MSYFEKSQSLLKRSYTVNDFRLDTLVFILLKFTYSIILCALIHIMKVLYICCYSRFNNSDLQAFNSLCS